MAGGSAYIICGIAEETGRTAMLVELAGCTARKANCGGDVTEAVNRLVSDAGGSADNPGAAIAACGNSGETA